MLKCSLHYDYHYGDWREEWTLDGLSVVYEQRYIDGTYMIIDHQSRVILVSNENHIMNQLFPQYAILLEPDAELYLLASDRPCDCTTCQK